jgi:hypothetical protein
MGGDCRIAESKAQSTKETRRRFVDFDRQTGFLIFEVEPPEWGESWPEFDGFPQHTLE